MNLLEKYDLARKETWRKHVLPRVTENEQVMIPTRYQCGTMIETSRPDIVALKKGGGSCTILGFLTKEKAKVEKSQEVQRNVARLEFEEISKVQTLCQL